MAYGNTFEQSAVFAGQRPFEGGSVVAVHPGVRDPSQGVDGGAAVSGNGDGPLVGREPSAENRTIPNRRRSSCPRPSVKATARRRNPLGGVGGIASNVSATRPASASCGARLRLRAERLWLTGLSGCRPADRLGRKPCPLASRASDHGWNGVVTCGRAGGLPGVGRGCASSMRTGPRHDRRSGSGTTLPCASCCVMKPG